MLFFRFFETLSVFSKTFFSSLVNLQYNALFKSLDLVEITKRSSSSPSNGGQKAAVTLGKFTINPQFALIAFNFIFFNFYGIFILQYDYTGEMFNLDNLSNSQYVLYRQIYPRSIWHQMDSLYGISTALCLLVYIHFTFQPMIDSKFKVFVDAGNSNRMTVNDKSM